MKRKYDLRNKRNFIIILILSILIIIIFSLFIYKYKHTSKIVYDIKTGSIIQDVNKNYINIDDDAILKVRWNGSYYLTFRDNKINLGKKVIVYNTIDGSIKLYGTFYEIAEDGKIIDNKDETVLANTTDTKFYKLDDREYLLVDRKIVSDDKSISADNYVLVELDKMGNAKLSNNKLNLKTITPTKLVTSKYVFDIANEVLKYNKLDIDLKKIIGSSNQYKEDEKKDDGSGGGEENKQQENTDFNNNDNNDGVNGAGNDLINDKDGKGEPITLDELKNKAKMTSIVRIQEGLTQVDIDYVVYDPYNEYQSVYVEVVKPGKVDVVNLSKSETHLVIKDLVPDKNYKLNFIYTIVDSETNEVKPNKFEEITVRTNKPVYVGKITKVSTYGHSIAYTVQLQSGYNIDSVNVEVVFYYQEFDENDELVTKEAIVPGTLNVKSGAKMASGTVDITGYDIVNIDLAKVIVKSVTGSDGTLTIS